MIKLTVGVCSILVLLIALVASVISIAPLPPKDNKCDTVRCGYGARCEIINGQAKCQCPSVCPQYILEICGSDGKTYGNTCFMNIQACKQKKEITKEYDGPCTEGSTKGPFRLSTHISPGLGLPKFTTPRPCIRNPPPHNVTSSHGALRFRGPLTLAPNFESSNENSEISPNVEAELNEDEN